MWAPQELGDGPAAAGLGEGVSCPPFLPSQGWAAEHLRLHRPRGCGSREDAPMLPRPALPTALSAGPVPPREGSEARPHPACQAAPQGLRWPRKVGGLARRACCQPGTEGHCPRAPLPLRPLPRFKPQPPRPGPVPAAPRLACLLRPGPAAGSLQGQPGSGPPSALGLRLLQSEENPPRCQPGPGHRSPCLRRAGLVRGPCLEGPLHPREQPRAWAYEGHCGRRDSNAT